MEETNVPMVISFTGQVNDNITFQYEDKALAHAACSFKLKDEYWVAGGLGAGMSKFQLKKIANCRLNIIRTLPLEFVQGACNTFVNQGVEEAWICFSVKTGGRCDTFNGTDFGQVENTNIEHKKARALSSYHGKPFVVGGLLPSVNRKTEIYDWNDKIWNENYQEYPYAVFNIANYASISLPDAVYVIGGTIDWCISSKVASFENDSWNEVGYLRTARQSLAAITNGNEIMIVGGTAVSDWAETEVWNLNFTDSRTIDEAKLPNGAYGLSELFFVSQYYCQS